MLSFVGLRAKMYACEVDGASTTKKAKGVKRYIVSNKISVDDYLSCLRENSERVYAQNNISSHKHQLYTVTTNKVALSPFDDKRYICSDGISTLPWGHYSIME